MEPDASCSAVVEDCLDGGVLGAISGTIPLPYLVSPPRQQVVNGGHWWFWNINRTKHDRIAVGSIFVFRSRLNIVVCVRGDRRDVNVSIKVVEFQSCLIPSIVARLLDCRIVESGPLTFVSCASLSGQTGITLGGVVQPDPKIAAGICLRRDAWAHFPWGRSEDHLSGSSFVRQAEFRDE